MNDFIRRNSSPVSNAELKIQASLNNRGFFPGTQKEFKKLITSADFVFEDIRLAIFIDGEQVHRDHEESDADKRDFVRKQGYKVRSFSYKAPITKTRLKEIVETIIDDVKGYRRLSHV